MSDLPFSKESQTARVQPRCKETGEPKRSCICFSCRGSRNRRMGRRKQREARKALERSFGQAARFSGALGNEETWRMGVRAEVKAGAQCKPLLTRFLAAEQQSDATKAIGDNRPFVFIAAPDGMSDKIVAFRLSKLEEVLAAWRKGEN